MGSGTGLWKKQPAGTQETGAAACHDHEADHGEIRHGKDSRDCLLAIRLQCEGDTLPPSHCTAVSFYLTGGTGIMPVKT